MDDPLRTVIAGMIAGALMGMVFVTHMALLLVFRPPNALREKAAESKVSNLITYAGLVAFLAWNILAIGLALAIHATLPSTALSISFAPSPVYLFVLAFITVLMLIPAIILFRDSKRHLVGEAMVLIGVYGFLLPNLVIAIQNS
ncbi:MAG: hypothetical protein VW271_08060 [Chloroflexota bacterium]